MKNRVIVGMSGGVDSSVAAWLLLQQGYEVIGLFMKNWHDDSVTLNNECPWVDDSQDALMVAEQLGIPFQVVDLSAEYKARIVDYMFAEYEAGRTPNPDVLCNREIKFDVFLRVALSLGADFVATGHYCRRTVSHGPDGQPVYHLMAGADPNKDQSYFLCQLSQEQLSKALFPIGELLKPQVRAIAEQQGLITAKKKDSQGLCFVGKIRLPDFLQQQLKPKEGRIIEVPATAACLQPVALAGAEAEQEELAMLTRPWHFTPADGKVVGMHQGAHFFTIGQRKGLHVGGKPLPLFVIATDTVENVVYVGQSEEHPGLYRKGVFIPSTETHWVRPDLALLPGQHKRYAARIRYRQELVPATLVQAADGLYVLFEQPQRGVAPGQFAAWYENDELIGSGVMC